MKTTFTKWWGLLLILLCWPLYLHFSQTDSFILSCSNYFFLAALVCFGCVAFVSVLRSGSFDLFQKSMRRLRFLKRNNEPEDMVTWSEIFSKPPMRFLLTGSVCLIVSLLFLLFQ